MLILLLTLSPLSVFSQTAQKNVTVKGFVKDAEGNPLIGATVSTPDGKRGTTTDAQGAFQISVEAEKGILEFSYLGYLTQQVVIGKRTVLDIELAPDPALAINEVVVIGYGQVKKTDLTGSVANVKMSDIKDSPVTSVDQALQGRIAGVDIMSTSGDPSATTSIRIRGTRSITASNEPLIVVDGVIDAVSDLSDINSADIESVSVLKDASSTAIYGSRGSNGVVIVTTKKGSGTTSRPTVTAKADIGVSSIARKLDLMDAREFARYQNDRSYFGSNFNDSRPIVRDPNEWGKGTDWLDAITRTTIYQNYNLSVSGRNKNTNYYAALGYNDTPGIIRSSGFRRITGRFNINHKFAKWFEVGFKGSYTFRRNDANKAAIGGTNIWGGAIYLSPMIGIYDDTNPIYENGTKFNTPRVCTDMIDNFSEQMTNTDVLIFTFTPVKGLRIRSQNSYMVYQRHDYQFWPSDLPKKTEGEGSDAYRYEGDARRLTSENTITYSRKFRSGHYFDIMGGFTASSEIINRFSLKAVGLVTDDLKWNNMNGIMSKDNYTASTQSSKVVRESVLARANYNYKQRYYITFTARADASSSFAANHKWGFFPSGAIKWNIRNERFMKSARWLDELAIRLSAGRTGNDAIAAYRSLEAYGTTTNGYLFDGSQSAAFYPSRNENPNLTWEKTTLYNVALDFAAFDNRLSFTVEGYWSKTNDLLLTLQTPHVTGYTSRYTNIGQTSNKGIEVTIESRNIVKPKFQWTTSLTLSHNKQMVDDIGQEEYVSALQSGGNTNYMMYGYKSGYPLNSLWGFKYAGVWKTAEQYERNNVTHSYVSSSTNTNPSQMRGYPKYVDTNNDGILSEEDLVYMGNSDPVLYGGMQNTFHIGQLKIGVYFSYSLGGKIYNYSELAMGGGYATNQYRYMLNAWHPVRNPDSNLPRAGTDDILVPSDLQIHDASYLRLKSVNISYTFDLRKKTKALRDITLSLSGENLWLWSRYNGFDPDVSTESGGSTLRRVDLGAYPRSRTFVFSLQLRY
ncbi:MAG: TonB-dependent receptor [Alistipes sp.]|nr:TonB-dependent receptor [Alistipes sp.]